MLMKPGREIRAGMYEQFTPKASHAASTSGLASCLKIFSCRKDPLNLVIETPVSNLSRIGADSVNSKTELGLLHH